MPENPHAGAARFAGVIAATLTPLDAEGVEVDVAAVEKLTVWLLERGVDGLFCGGTTGEGLLLTHDQWMRLTRATVEAADGRGFVIAHCGALSTEAAVARARSAHTLGADAIAVLAPPFYPLDDEAVSRHFVTVAQASELPFFVYQIPSHSGHDVPATTVARLRTRIDTLSGVKDSSTSLDQLRAYLTLDGLTVLVGGDERMLAGLRFGAAGVVSGIASVFPEMVLDVAHAQRAGSNEQAERAQARLTRARELLAQGPPLAAMKLAARERGLGVRESLRGPLRALDTDERDLLLAALNAERFLEPTTQRSHA
jgi:dihydrodipicolinate synthase/N-acetylneuraminate lyase